MTDEVEVKGRYRLTKPWVKTELIRALAEGKVSQTDLAKKYGVGQPAIAEFKKRHAADIESLLDSLNDEWIGIWAADKKNRLAVLQSQVESVLELQTSARNAETIDRLLRSIAEELGDITNKSKVEMDVVRYEIANINVEDLT